VTLTVTTPLPHPLGEHVGLPVRLGDDQLETPALLVDLDIVDENIRRMQVFADREGFALRPHVKSHKSLAMARRQLEAGARGVCVATATEALVMAASDAPDVLVAYPLVGRSKLSRLQQLADEDRLTLVTDSVEVTAGYRDLASLVGRPIRVLVEVDTGMHRVGATPRHVVDLATDIERGGQLQFAGILTHAGHAHDVPRQSDIERVAREEAAIMGAVREDLETAGFDVPVVSAGSTITAPYLRRADGVTEIRPGTYIYNDLRTAGRYACTIDMIAASMLATVVSTSGSRVTLDAGSKTLTSSRDAEHGYGLVVGHEDAVFTRLSEEHGVLGLPQADASLAVGDRVRILPIHVCVWMDLQPEVYGTRAGQIVERITVDAMRHSL
jgi:D-serine deaminase-like pyridoxal phosphate-dependent protein